MYLFAACSIFGENNMDNIREQNDTLLKRITEILFFFTEKVRWMGRANDD